MNIIQYINSIDVARHLERIGYEFSAPDAAFIIWQSHKVSLAEKHRAWQDLIDTTPDCPVESRYAPQESLHSFLKSYMDMENRLLEQFFKQVDGYSYRYRFLLTHKDDEWKDSEYKYPDYESCYAAWLKDFSDTRFHCKIIKEKIFDSHENRNTMKLHLYRNDIVMGIQALYLSDDDEQLTRVFDGMWLNIPTPFEKGDVLISPYGPYGGSFHYDNGSYPFALTHICNWDEHPRYTDNSDMTASGYFINDDGSVYHECMHNYLDCEYYRGTFDGVRRTLNLISKFLKDEIDIGLCVNAYHIILNEENANRATQCLGYTKQGLDLAGLSKSTNYPMPENPHSKYKKPKYTVDTFVDTNT